MVTLHRVQTYFGQESPSAPTSMAYCRPVGRGGVTDPGSGPVSNFAYIDIKLNSAMQENCMK